MSGPLEDAFEIMAKAPGQIVLVHHRALGGDVFVGPFATPEDVALWLVRRAPGEPTLDGVRREAVTWGMIVLQDPADPDTPDWNAP